MDGLHGVSEVPKDLCKLLSLCTFGGQKSPWAVNQEAVNQGKLRTTGGLETDVKQNKSPDGAHVNKTGSNAHYLRCKITKGAVFSKQKENMI